MNFFQILALDNFQHFKILSYTYFLDIWIQQEIYLPIDINVEDQTSTKIKNIPFDYKLETVIRV